LEQVALSQRGTLWSYTENRYAPPPPYPSQDPFEPFAVAAVQLEHEGLIVLGKVVEGTLAADLRVGIEMELTTMPLFTDDDGAERMVYAWRIPQDAEAGTKTRGAEADGTAAEHPAAEGTAAENRAAENRAAEVTEAEL
jgi:hypothetical protein